MCIFLPDFLKIIFWKKNHHSRSGSLLQKEVTTYFTLLSTYEGHGATVDQLGLESPCNEYNTTGTSARKAK